MGQTILNRLGVSDEAAEPETHPETQEPPETGVTEEAAEEAVEDPAEAEDKLPVIGMDGKTEDGSMPYEILKDKLEWLK